MPGLIARPDNTLAEAPMEHDPSHAAVEYSGTNEKITHPAQIAGLLRRVHEERALLTISLPGSNDQFKSVVLEVDLAKNFVLLDELHPHDGHGRLLAVKKFHAHTRLKGVDISFGGILEGATQENGMALYQVALPTQILYRQRRSSFRVRVGAGLIVPVTLSNQNLLQLQGELCDISTGGIGLRLKLDPTQAIDNGSIFPDCNIQLPSNEHVHSGLELRFISPADARNMVRFGGRFLGLESSNQKLIEHFVASLERELLRRRPKD